MLRTPHAEVITTQLAVEIVVESALLAILKQNAHQARATDQDRGHFLNDDSTAPLFIIDVDHFVSESKIEALVSVH
jgi:hypothetical protein